MRHRRSHTKSRKGCLECKRRKTKCDENSPCFNCSRYGVDCSLAFCATAPSNTSTVAFISLSIVGNQTGVSPGTPLSSHISGSERQVLSWRDVDLELMYHYSIHTANTMAHREDMRYVWRQILPQQGFTHTFVTRGILSLSAVHMAYLNPARRDYFLDIAAEHQTIGLRRFREIIESTRPTTDEVHPEWTALFCYGTLTIAHVCALPIRSPANNGLPDPLNNTVELFDVIRGINAIMGAFIDHIKLSDIAPLATGIWVRDCGGESPSHAVLAHSILPDSTFDALQGLQEWLEHVHAQDTHPATELHTEYIAALDALRTCASQLAAAGRDPEIGTVMIWPFLIPRSVMAEMRAMAPRSLVLLAHWAVLFSLLEPRWWFVVGWGRAVVDGVYERVRHECAERLLWARRSVIGNACGY